METERGHDRRFSGGADRLRSAERLALMEVPRVVALSLEGLAPQAMLDVGTGTGVFAEAFAARGISVTGVDVNAELLMAAGRLLPSGSFREAPAERLPFADSSFDLVFLGLVLHETDDPLAALREARRVTRQRAAILEWPCSEGRQGPPLAHRIKEETILALAGEAGFSKTRIVRMQNLELYLLDA